jgi:hypothetical protein
MHNAAQDSEWEMGNSRAFWGVITKVINGGNLRPLTMLKTEQLVERDVLWPQLP